jgi:hypothetical protein
MLNIPDIKVELEVDPSAGLQPFFTLDDPITGELDGSFGLGGLSFADATEYVQEVRIKRGKLNPLDRFDAGSASVVFDNTTRFFDPLGTSPFSQQLLPRRGIRIFSADVPIFVGIVEDWNLDYDRSGDSKSIAVATDKFLLLASQELEEFFTTEQKSGDRIVTILNKPEVLWPAGERDIDTGQVELQDDFIEDNTNVLEYLQLIAESESGSLFLAADGKLTFFDKLKGPSSVDLVTFSDDGVELPFQEIKALYGGEFLYNRVIIQALLGVPQISEDTTSQTFYGISTLSITDLLMKNDADAASKSAAILNKYKEPNYRFESLTTNLNALDETESLALLNRDLTDVIQVKFTPNQIGAEIDKLGAIIGIEHSIQPGSHRITFNLDTLDFAPFVLDDAVFGVLDEYGLG